MGPFGRCARIGEGTVAILVEILLRCIERGMRADPACEHEEGAVAVFFDVVDGFVCDPSRAVVFFGNLRDLRDVIEKGAHTMLASNVAVAFAL